MDKPLMIFDGDCGICTWSSEWVAKHDKNDALAITPYQTADLAQYGLTPAQTNESVYLVLPDGTRHKEGRAVFETLKRLPGVYGALGALLATPVTAALARPVYRWVANNRTAISRRFGLKACELPQTEAAP